MPSSPVGKTVFSRPVSRKLMHGLCAGYVWVTAGAHSVAPAVKYVYGYIKNHKHSGFCEWFGQIWNLPLHWCLTSFAVKEKLLAASVLYICSDLHPPENLCDNSLYNKVSAMYCLQRFCNLYIVYLNIMQEFPSPSSSPERTSKRMFLRRALSGR